HEASLAGMILTPCFLSKPMTEAMTTEAQSVSGMKPIFTSAFSGASEPAAQALARINGSISESAPSPAAAVAPSKARRPGSTTGSGGEVTARMAWERRGGSAAFIGAPCKTSAQESKQNACQFLAG